MSGVFRPGLHACLLALRPDLRYALCPREEPRQGLNAHLFAAPRPEAQRKTKEATQEAKQEAAAPTARAQAPQPAQVAEPAPSAASSAPAQAAPAPVAQEAAPPAPPQLAAATPPAQPPATVSTTLAEAPAAPKQQYVPMAREEVLPQLERLFTERIAYIDGAMGTMIQRYKLEVR